MTGPTTKSYIKTEGVSENKDTSKKVFFPNLDGLRFICFLLVFLFHSYKTIFQTTRHTDALGSPSLFFTIVEFLFQNGELGVNFFFVLSGFLITFLLMKEKKVSRNIHLRNFYLRRILRIWPLFFVCIFIGFVVLPLLKTMAGGQPSEVANPLYYIFFINNFDYINSWPDFPDALILIVLWSVAVEEQFYLTWPIILKYLPEKSYPAVFAVIVVFTLVFRSFYTGQSNHDYAVRNFHTLSVIGDMALGGLMAYYCSAESKFLTAIKNLAPWQIVSIYVAALSAFLFKDYLFEAPLARVFERVIFAILFGLIILEQNFSHRSLFKFSSFKLLSKLGLYTYSLYCLHFFLISVLLGGVQKAGFKVDNFWIAAFVTILSLIAVIGSAIFSYNKLEMPFLKIKDRFAFIKKA